MKARLLATLALALLALAGCGGESSAATLAGPLNYHRDGGFAGVSERLAIQPDGRARVQGGSRGKRSFTLRKADLNNVARLVREANLARVKTPKAGDASDLFYYAVSYRGRTLRFDDISMPKRVSELVGELNALVQKYGGGLG